nr:uncharacterized protein LOC109191080 [Ipomoea batatas]
MATGGNMGMAEWIAWHMKALDDFSACLLLTICWKIWESRNQKLWRNLSTDPRTTSEEARYFLQAWRCIHPYLSSPAQITTTARDPNSQPKEINSCDGDTIGRRHINHRTNPNAVTFKLLLLFIPQKGLAWALFCCSVDSFEISCFWEGEIFGRGEDETVAKELICGGGFLGRVKAEIEIGIQIRIIWVVFFLAKVMGEGNSWTDCCWGGGIFLEHFNSHG